MAERISSAASAPTEPVATSPEPVTVPVATPEATPTPASPAPTPEPDLQFEDEPEPLKFDDEPEPAAAAEAPAPAKPEAADDQKAVADLAALLKNGGLPKPVEDALMRTNRGRNLLSLYKSERVLKESPNFDPATGRNAGGLGFMPTPDQIKEFHQGHADWQANSHEFAANPQSWAVNWFGPDRTGNFRDGVDKVLASVPQVIDQAYNHAVSTGNQAMQEQSVALYRTVFTPMLTSYLDGFYARANQIQDPAERDRVLDAARAIEIDVLGKVRGDGQPAASPKPDDAFAARERELTEREARFNAWQTKALTDAQKQAENEIFSNIEQNLTKDLEKALSTVKDGMSPRAFRAAVNDFKAEVKEAVRKDHIGSRDFNFSLSTARTARGADARTAPVQTYRQIAQRVIQSRYRTVLQELGTDALRQNGAAHAAAANSAAQTAPAANGGQPPSQSVVAEAKIARRPGEDNTDYFQRRLAAKMGSPN